MSGNFSIRQFLQFSHDDDLSILQRERFDAIPQWRHTRFLNQAGFGGHGTVGSVGRFVKGNVGESVFLPATPSETCVADDRHQPCLAIPALEAVEKAEGAQVCFLNDILRVIFIARQPAREVVGDFKCGRIVSSKSVSLVDPSIRDSSRKPFGSLGVARFPVRGSV